MSLSGPWDGVALHCPQTGIRKSTDDRRLRLPVILQLPSIPPKYLKSLAQILSTPEDRLFLALRLRWQEFRMVG
jgi:hypothetical protein